jgi:hypothetical protein
LAHNRPPRIPLPETGTPDEQFEELRQRFHERLRKEQNQLTSLTKALTNPNVASASIFPEICAFAHRLRGAAVVFGLQRLGECAKAVEVAASTESPDTKGARFQSSVAMQALASNLADEIGTSAACGPGGK